MSEEKHLFRLNSVWIGNSDGDGTLTTAWGGQVAYGVPEELGGKPGRTNPEELLLSAVVSCYSITLALLAERRRLPLTRLEVTAEGEVVRQPDRTLKYTAIRLAPKMVLASSEEAQRQAALDCAQKAEVYCVISRAVRGNIEISVTPEVRSAE